MSSIASDPCDYDMGFVKGLGTKMIDFPIFEERRDPEAHIDWKWQCLALGWWNQAGKLRTLHENTHPLTWEELKELMRFKYVPRGYTKLFNVDPRRPILRRKVGICGALGLDLVLDDGYSMNYITPEVVAYLGLPRL
ncbi:hypothetical protein R3W88_022567 [Solanum pinnatisectum]|uniref:Uncharacterized protein n=1 Tax=Solanum pinnatisectum TaxID=50273 RepID=A0AAV9LUY6_9SOLN|nr:hypothetical protein R3W88_022567 [Solanum pinnatisectum]